MNLVGGQTLHVTEDRVLMQTEFGTNLGNFHSDQDFLILDQDSEDLVMGVQWYNYIFREPHHVRTKIVDIRARGLMIENPINMGQHLAPEDDILEGSTIGVFLTLNWKNGRHATLILTFRNWIL